MNPGKLRMVIAAEELVAEVDALLPKLRDCSIHAADNLQRSAESVLFNTAEGAGAYRPKVKIASYEVAQKEANEVRVILRLSLRRRLVTRDDALRALGLIGAIIGMLTSACKALQDRK